MDLKEAIKSGKRFKRKDMSYYYLSNKSWDRIDDEYGNMDVKFTYDDVMGEDWEIEQEKQEITLDQAYLIFKLGYHQGQYPLTSSQEFKTLLKDLGFTDIK